MREVVWVGSSLDDLRAFPDEVRTVFGYALYLAHVGDKHPNAKPLKGFGGTGVLEVTDEYAGDAYRAVYTVTLPGAVFVLHAFQKKSTRGIATSRRDLDLIRQRLQRAREIAARRGPDQENDR
jgi:phage-related protein